MAGSQKNDPELQQTVQTHLQPGTAPKLKKNQVNHKTIRMNRMEPSYIINDLEENQKKTALLRITLSTLRQHRKLQTPQPAQADEFCVPDYFQAGLTTFLFLQFHLKLYRDLHHW